MPVASGPAGQKDAQAQFTHHISSYHHLLSPKSPVPFPHGHPQCADSILAHAHETVAAAYMSEGAGALGNRDSQGHFISTHSPPLLNLSPNLSPGSAESQRSSPFYDLRESTRRRSIQDIHSQQMQHQPQLLTSLLAADDAGRKSESPSRKRRKISGSSSSLADVTNNPASPQSPGRNWDLVFDSASRTRRRSSSQRRASIDRCNTPRARRSPATRRRIRERFAPESPERRAFQPPGHSPRQPQPHPALVTTSLPHSHTHPTGTLDSGQIPASTPMTMPPYAIPVCAGPQFPVCTAAAHMAAMCSGVQTTWSLPPCTLQLHPSCGFPHLPTCALPPMPVPPHLPHLLHHPPHHTSHHAHPPPPHPLSLPPNTHYHHSTHSLQEEEVPIMADHRQAYAHNTHLHHPTLQPPSPPVLLQEPPMHPAPHDVYGPYSRVYHHTRRSTTRSRLRSMHVPPQPYPGFLLHFLAMLGNPPMPPYGRDVPDDVSEVENYEALLNLAERLGEAKPRGLLKADIEVLPTYRFNAEVRRSDLDQTSCVVCMCDFENRQLLRVLPCSHEFHAKCVDKWLKNNRTCPICRADASEVCASSE